MSGKSNFTIDDAFDPDDDDIVRTYGSTTESTPLKPRQDMTATDSVAVRVEEPRDRNNRSSCSKPLRLKLPEENLSKDSDSLIQCDQSFQKYDARDGWWTHPKVRENWRVMLAAFGLLLAGLGLIATGIVVQILPRVGVQGLVFFIAGAICFIPGAYHVVYVYCAVKGYRGYDFYNLPLFN
ncbi:transmembrane protein 134 isoform X2 [Dermacentor andersoni]|uniref:transmembrane protein 134 isoform X2 n=1 Tax=Dermacentor andersoni TaxID=34620 RepID=UPI00215577B2|nr:transmembrane protein 134-like isoform X2 [Dermacentor andersoni]